MRVLHTRNVHQALPKALALLQTNGVKVDTRNGAAWQVPGGVATVYERPMERVMFHPARDANPFFHLYESMWMLAGRRDVESLARYVPRMAEFSDDGSTFNAAYGYRWRHATTLDVDQLRVIVEQLRAKPSTRQAVLQIWTLKHDLLEETKDHACNIAATFQENPGDPGSLDMVVFCRSNDIVWGAYGANAVHMSYLLEYVAWCAGFTMGTYTQVSVNWHGYESTAGPLMAKLTKWQRDGFTTPFDATGWGENWCRDLYHDYTAQPHSIEPHAMRIHDQAQFDDDLRRFTDNGGRAVSGTSLYQHAFFYDVAVPIVEAHDAWKDNRDHVEALRCLAKCQATDWRLACEQWIQRRIK